MFERSASGIRNRAAFYGVDVVIYVEGDLERSDGNDANFWESIFSTILTSKTFRAVAKGGKYDLLKIAERLHAFPAPNDREDCVVAVDADLHRFGGSHCGYRNLIETYGYSFENDLLNSADWNRILPVLCPARICSLDYFKHWAIQLRRMKRIESLVGFLNIWRVQHGKEKLGPDKTGKIVQVKNGIPVLAKTEFQKFVEPPLTPKKFPTHHQLSGHFCCGKSIISKYGQMILACNQKFGWSKGVTKDQLIATLTNQLCDLLKSGPKANEVSHYYYDRVRQLSF